MSIKLSIVVPCYNEMKNIPLILERFNMVIQRKDIEVILVNNGSTDDSNNVFTKLVPQYSFAKTIKVDINRGYGFGVISGLKECRGEFIGWTHADMQTDPRDTLMALEIIEQNHYDNRLYIKGLRKGRPLFDQIFTTGMSLFETCYLRSFLYDINAQPNIFHRSFFETWDSPPHDFSLDLYALYMAKRKKLKIIRFPVVFPKRIHGQSSWNTGIKSKWKFIKRTVNFSKKLKSRIST